MESIIDSSDRFSLSKDEDFIGRVGVLSAMYSTEILDASMDDPDRDMSLLRELAQDVIRHPEEYTKRFPVLVAAMLPFDGVSEDVSDETLLSCIQELFRLYTGEEL